MAWPDLPMQVDQSLRVLCRLARARGPLKAGEIARREEIRPAQAAKVLEHLTRAGFAHSRRGMRGGYWLQVSAERIRIGDVLASFSPRGQARKPKSNAVTNVVREIAEPARKAFERLTIADISGSRPKKLTVKEGTNEAPSRTVR
jgi:Rrf2 family protein